MGLYTGKGGELRIYDASGLKATVKFEQMDYSGPMGRARPEEIEKMSRLSLDTDAAHVQGDDLPILEPLEVGFSFLLSTDAATQDLIGIITGTAAGIQSTKGSSSLPSGSGQSFSIPAFRDPTKKTLDWYCKWDSGLARAWKEVWTPLEAVELSESDDGIILSTSGLCFGDITTILGILEDVFTEPFNYSDWMPTFGSYEDAFVEPFDSGSW
jgi:hypothetical protein